MYDDAPHFSFRLNPERSEWSCYLFGASKLDGFCWTPIKGQEPNAFWRMMQFLILGNRWVRTPKTGEGT